MQIDIREIGKNETSSILYADSGDEVIPNSFNSCCIQDSEGDLVIVRFDDVDNLIKALQKAKELWA